MRYSILILCIAFFFFSCAKEEENLPNLSLETASIGEQSLDPDGSSIDNAPTDRPITLTFSHGIAEEALPAAISLTDNEGNTIDFSYNLLTNKKTLTLSPKGGLETGRTYTLKISPSIHSTNTAGFAGATLIFSTKAGEMLLTEINFEEGIKLGTNKYHQVNPSLKATLRFDAPISENSRSDIGNLVKITGDQAGSLEFQWSEDFHTLSISATTALQELKQYTLSISEQLLGEHSEYFGGYSLAFYTGTNGIAKFPLISDEELLTKVQRQTFEYFWSFGHPVSGMTRERNTSGNTVTTGGSGFGAMAMIVGVERGFISRTEAISRWVKMVDFLAAADRFHGAWPHWIHGETGKTIPFSTKDNGGDLVETALLIQGLLTVRAYLNTSSATELALSDKITQLWEEVEWSWYTKGGGNILYWHWSPEYAWEMNLPVRGYNEALITYVLAASSETYPIAKGVYEEGWAKNGSIKNGGTFYGEILPLGSDRGGPLFFAHYSFLGLDPRNLSDQYANYWEQNLAHTKINRAYCIENPKDFAGYGEEAWGLTASDNHQGYNAHSPTNDLGVISPTAALSSMPYTPVESMEALRYFYYDLGERSWGEYGFKDAFNISENWYADSYLAIDQGPILLMIENHRTGLLWDTFMKDPEIQNGLEALGFSY